MASRKIEDLHKSFQPMVQQLIEQGNKAIQSTGWLFFITDGFRSFEEQTELYSHGRFGDKRPIVTNAMAGESPHNYGLAVDCAFQKNGVLSYDNLLYSKIYPIARSLGFELGADWISFKDKPHFEHSRWEIIIEKEKETMSNMFKLPSGQSLDIGNPEVNKVTANTWDEVVNQKLYIRKDQYEAEMKIANEAFNSTIRQKEDKITELNKQIDQLKLNINTTITPSNELPKTYNGKKVIGVMIEP